MKSLRGKGLLALMALLLFLPPPACAEIAIFIYIGKLFTEDGKLHLKRGSTDLTFHDVRWEDESFKNPVFYGVRASYWFDRRQPWGVAVDFTHAKTILVDDIVAVRGSRYGSPVEGRERISDTIQHFELSHGLNMVTFNALHRWFPSGTRDHTPSGRLQAYTGIGAGFSIPHVEAHLEDSRTGRYQIAAGPVINGMLGLNYDFARAAAGILEYKWSYADVHADLKGGGNIDAKTSNHQFISGLAGSFDPR